ncbi:hypothetical protein JD969_06240 [Planctomycetota bacterium]|nr:hypothetical protein JD969_06240 [Planctomycetota bacterium]
MNFSIEDTIYYLKNDLAESLERNFVGLAKKKDRGRDDRDIHRQMILHQISNVIIVCRFALERDIPEENFDDFVVVMKVFKKKMKQLHKYNFEIPQDIHQAIRMIERPSDFD